MIAFARLVHKADDAAFAEGDRLVPGRGRVPAVPGGDGVRRQHRQLLLLGHNYYLYLHPTTNKLHFIPWDLDRAFANFGSCGPPASR